MKKILLFLLLITICSCSDVGYIATIEVRRYDTVDTINVPYTMSQFHTGATFGPILRIEDGVLKEGRFKTISTNVKSFSLLNYKKLED